MSADSVDLLDTREADLLNLALSDKYNNTQPHRLQILKLEISLFVHCGGRVCACTHTQVVTLKRRVDAMLNPAVLRFDCRNIIGLSMPSFRHCHRLKGRTTHR